MKVTRKDATIVNTDDDFPGTFRVVLSAPTRDRDGDTLAAEEWKTPLPDHITFDIDHGMSVASTVGSGKPWLDMDNTLGAGKGALIVDGTYSSLGHAQDTRTLVKEGHVNRTSVAFMTEKTQKDGRSTVVRELLNGAFVAVPSNREAVVLESKGLKAGARNSRSDQDHLDAILAHAVALGATGGDTDRDEDVATGKAFRAAAGLKAVAGSYEQTQQAISDALGAAYPRGSDDQWVYAYPTATFGDTVVYRVSGDTVQAGQWQADYTLNSDGTVTLGAPSRVNLVEQIVPITGDSTEKAADPATVPVPAAKAAGTATAAAEDDSIEKQAAAARFRLYATLSER